MIFFGALTGIFSYVIFSIGIVNLLYPAVIFLIVTIYLLVLLFHFKGDFLQFMRLKNYNKDKIDIFLFCILLIAIGVNFIGVMGPEIGFDALWYHLSIPKIYLQQHAVSFIPGNLLYYSAMPKLGEMLYVVGLVFGSEVFTKCIHFFFGTLCLVLLYKTLRLFTSTTFSLCGCLIFYSNLVVGWESTSTYIDLIRTFYELAAVYCFVIWQRTKNDSWLWYCAMMVGFAITTKLLAFGSFFILLFLLGFTLLRDTSYTTITKKIVKFTLITLCVPFPWFVFSFIHTGSPFYPFFTAVDPVTHSLILSPIVIAKDIITLFLFSSDPISILYLLFLPLVLIVFSYCSKEQKTLFIYSFLALGMWYITPRMGGGRFILPYLPILSMLVVFVLKHYEKNNVLRMIFIFLIVTTSVLSIGYRFAANSKYIPFIVGKETKSEFLQQHLHFSFGDFYDVDGYFAKNISQNDRVLLYGFHNLYYVNFPFVHESYVKENDMFNFIATQNIVLPQKYMHWKRIYTNSTTHVTLFSNNKRWEKYTP